MSKEITLSKGYVALVDDNDFERVNQHTWSAHVYLRKDGSIRNVYAMRSIRKEDGTWTKQRLHRFIPDVTDPAVQVDHASDHSGLNCTRENLRLATHAENQRNQRVRADNSSGIKGVCRNKQRNKWQAEIRVNGKLKHLGLFTSITDAKQAYDSAAKKYHGQFACTNEMLQAA